MYQNTHIVGGSDSLFYTPVKIGGTVALGAMLNSGSMACTVRETAMCSLLAAGVVSETERFSTDVTLVGVRCRKVHPNQLLILTWKFMTAE